MSRADDIKARLAQLDAMGQTAAPAAPKTRREEIQARLAELPKEKEAWYEDFGEGLAVSGLETYYGTKDLFGQMDDEDRATLKDWQDDAAESGWGTAGQVVGELGTFMIPGGIALKGLKVASKLKNATLLQKAMVYGAVEGAVGAGVGGVKLPEAGETRLENMLESGAAGAIGGGLAPVVGRGLSKLLRGANKSDDALRLLDEGVELTPGQMASSPGIRGLETVMEVTPFLARGTKKAKKKSLESWNKKIMSDAAPVGANITELGTAGAAQMKRAVTSAYNEAWKGAGKLSRGDGVGMINSLGRSSKRLGIDDNRVITNIIKDIKELAKKGSTKGTQALDDLLRRSINSAGKDKYELSEALQQARAGLRKRLPAKTKKALDKIDAKYPGYLTVRDAVARAQQTEGLFTPAQLTTSVGKLGKGKAQVGEAALQDAARTGRSTLGKKEGGQPLEWFRRIAGALPSPLPMETAGRTLMGQTTPQRALLKQARSPRVRALREMMSQGGATAALTTD